MNAQYDSHSIHELPSAAQTRATTQINDQNFEHCTQHDAGPASPPPLPVVSTPRLPAHLDALSERARDYVEAASAANTRRAYTSDRKQFASWCRRQDVEMFPPDPQVVGLYITACAAGGLRGCVDSPEQTDSEKPAY